MAVRRRKHFLWVTPTVLILIGLGVFAAKSIWTKPVKIDPEKLAKVERIDLIRSVVATGKIQPETQVEVKSKASGIIQKLPVNVGDVVHKGQVICELDQNDLLPALRQQQAALHVAEAALKTARADYDRYKVDAEGRDVPFLKTPATIPRKITRSRCRSRNRRWPISVRRRPRLPRPKPLWSSSRPLFPRRRRICATPPSFRPWTA